VAHGGAVVILGQLLDNAGRRVLTVGGHDVDRDRGQPDFAGGQRAPLPGADQHGAVLVADRGHRGQNPVLSDRVQELGGQVGLGPHIRLGRQKVGIKVFESSGSADELGHDCSFWSRVNW
jgi:hypothetical protein